MAQIQPNSPEPREGPEEAPSPTARRPRGRALRYGVPVAVVGLTAATIGLVPALADTGGPDLPDVTAEELVAKVAGSETDQVSGTVKVATDLGLPSLPGIDGSGSGSADPFSGSGAERGSGGGHGSSDEGSSAAPQQRLATLLSGEHTLRVAADGPTKQRVSLVEKAAEYSVIRNGDEVWAYDSASDAAWHAAAPKGAKSGEKKAEKAPQGSELAELTPRQAARQALAAADGTTSVSVDGTAHVAGRDAYQLVVAPKGAPHSTVESARIWVDAKNGTPLKFALDTKDDDDGGTRVLDIGYTDVDFGAPSADTFSFTPPKGTDVTEAKPGKDGAGDNGGKGGKNDKGGKQAPGHGMPGAEALAGGGLDVLGEGWGSVAKVQVPKGALPGGAGSTAGSGGAGQGAELLDGLTEKANGKFGSGRVLSTHLVNALVTDDGTAYIGAVTKDGLIAAADSAAER